MLEKYLKSVFIFMVIIGCFTYLLTSGAIENLLVKKKDLPISPAVLYCIAQLYVVVQNYTRAEDVFWKVIENFPKSHYYEKASYAYFMIADKTSKKHETVLRGQEHLKEFPDSENRDFIRKRVRMFQGI